MKEMVCLSLTCQKNRRWFNENGLFVKGYLFDSKGRLYEDSDLLSYFNSIKTETEFSSKLKEANGLFSVVLQLDGETFASVDRLRSFPLFYTLKEGAIYIADEILNLFQINAFKISEQSQEEFSHLGYTLGSKTLVDSVCQLQAGEYIYFSKEVVRRGFYHIQSDVIIEDRTEAEWKFCLKNIIDKIAKRLISQLKGRPVALPLSGGYDSRLIAYMLFKENYSDVICFTYGKPTENIELKNSQKVAGTLNFEWVFIDYLKYSTTNYINDPIFLEYCEYITQYSSCYFYQEFPAIQYLINERRISKDTVFLPGHGGDFLAGSHLRSFMNTSYLKGDVEDHILNSHFKNRVLKREQRRKMKMVLSKEIKEYPSYQYPYQCFENWDLKERQAKYIVNSSKIWEFFDFNYTLPLFDTELMDFFASMPFKYKLGKRLYDEVLRELFDEVGIAFEDDYKLREALNPSMDWIKNRIKTHLPFIRKRTNLWAFDSVGFKYMMQGLMDELHQNGCDKDIRNYNGATFEWFLLHKRRKF